MAMSKLDLAGGPDFKRELARLTRRIERINALLDGRAKLVRIRIPAHWVERYHVPSHYQFRIVKKEPTKRRSK